MSQTCALTGNRTAPSVLQDDGLSSRTGSGGAPTRIAVLVIIAKPWKQHVSFDGQLNTGVVHLLDGIFLSH